MTQSSLITIPPAELEAMMERASAAGAKRALAEVGLHDEAAGQDVRELRGLIGAWREARREMWRTISRTVTMAVLLALAAGVAVGWFKVPPPR